MELINRLKTNIKFLKDLPNEAANDFVKDYEDAIAAIEFLSEKELKNQYPSKWTPASNPPKVKGKYLVIIKCPTLTSIDIIYYSLNLYQLDKYDFYDKKRPGWYNYNSEFGYYEVSNIIAWSPLPDIPDCYNKTKKEVKIK